MPTHIRVLNTFRAWGINVDEAFFMGGVPKTGILQEFRPHIFFDDQESHCRLASEVVPTGRVLAAMETQSLVAAAPADSGLSVESSTEVSVADIPPSTFVAAENIERTTDAQS